MVVNSHNRILYNSQNEWTTTENNRDKPELYKIKKKKQDSKDYMQLDQFFLRLKTIRVKHAHFRSTYWWNETIQKRNDDHKIQYAFPGGSG